LDSLILEAFQLQLKAWGLKGRSGFTGGDGESDKPKSARGKAKNEVRLYFF